MLKEAETERLANKCRELYRKIDSILGAGTKNTKDFLNMRTVTLLPEKKSSRKINTVFRAILPAPKQENSTTKRIKNNKISEDDGIQGEIPKKPNEGTIQISYGTMENI